MGYVCPPAMGGLQGASGRDWTQPGRRVWPRLLWSAGRWGYFLVSCEAWLSCRVGGWVSQWDMHTSTNRLEGEFQNASHQCLSPQGMSQLVPASRCLKISKWVTFTYGPWAFQSSVFALFSCHGNCVGVLWGKISVPWSSVVFLHVFSVGFQSQVFWGLVSLVQDLRVGVPVVELEPLPPQEKDPYLCGPSQLGITTAGVWFLPWWGCLSAFPTHLDSILLLFVLEALFI